jgi:hypothetical protein
MGLVQAANGRVKSEFLSEAHGSGVSVLGSYSGVSLLQQT